MCGKLRKCHEKWINGPESSFNSGKKRQKMTFKAKENKVIEKLDKNNTKFNKEIQKQWENTWETKRTNKCTIHIIIKAQMKSQRSLTSTIWLLVSHKLC